MKSSDKEPHYKYSELDAATKSPLAKKFIEERAKLAEVLARSENRLTKRFLNIDHNTYLEGALGADQKELIGLACSLALRCDDCIAYHVIQCYRSGWTREKIEEGMSVAMVVGGSIVVPHLRRALAMLEELYA